MDQDPEVVPTGQGKPNIPHKRGTGTHFNPEGVPLQAASSRGRGNPDTSSTSEYHGKYPGRGGDCSGIAETTNWVGVRNIRDEGRKPEGMVKGGNMRKVSRHKTVGKTGKCDKAVILKGVHPDSTGMDEDGVNS